MDPISLEFYMFGRRKPPPKLEERPQSMIPQSGISLEGLRRYHREVLSTANQRRERGIKLFPGMG